MHACRSTLEDPTGTLGELAIAYDEGKLIGVLTGTGGISDIAREILAACKKVTGARVLYSADPDELVTDLLEVYRTEHHRRPSCFCADAVCSPGPEASQPCAATGSMPEGSPGTGPGCTTIPAKPGTGCGTC